MRLGLFGGTFDPIHLGHLILAESCREALALDELWFVVTATPPHKRGARTDVRHRLEMARIAIAGHKIFCVSEIEADASQGPHYTFETLEALKAQRPGDDLFFLIGGDSQAEFSSWRNPDRIAQLATVVVVDRPGIDAPRSNIPVWHVTSPLIGISSTELRDAVAKERSIRYRVPRGVEMYIYEHQLYR